MTAMVKKTPFAVNPVVAWMQRWAYFASPRIDSYLTAFIETIGESNIKAC
jgi:hypothetical protein